MKNKFLCLVLSLCMMVGIIEFHPESAYAEAYAPIAVEYYNGHKYAVFDISLTWSAASNYCNSLGGHLATITSTDEQSHVNSIAFNSQKSMLWLGGSDIGGNGHWTWITDESWMYSNWYNDEPTGKRTETPQEYLAMYTYNAKTTITSEAIHGSWLDQWNNGAGAKWTLENTGFVCEWDNYNVGTSNSTITSNKSPVYSTGQEKILNDLKIDTNNLLSNISLGNHTINGPSITFNDKTFYLFEFNGKLNLELGGLPVSAAVDADSKTVKILVGFKDYSGSADISGDANNSTYWSQSYQQVKSMYQDVTGKKVDTTKLWNKFSSLRGELKKINAGLVVDADCNITGYMELSYETGSVKFSEGGLIMAANIGGEFSAKVPAFPAAYVVMGLNASVDGQISVAYQNYISVYTELGADLTANVGIGLGDKKIVATYIEGGLEGTLGADMKIGSGIFANTAAAPLVVTVEGAIYIKGAFLGFLNSEKHWPISKPVQLYPRNDISLMSLSAFGDNSTDEIISNSTPLSRDYLYDVMLLTIDDSDKLYSDKSIYSYNSPSLVSLSNGRMLLLWIDDLGTKNDINKTSLMYSIYNDEVWSEPKELFETGVYNGSPVIYDDGENVHILWSKAKTVFADNAGLADLMSDVELYYSQYDGNGFSEPIRVTDNSLFELNYCVTEDNGKVAVAWTENSENDPYMTSGINRLYTREWVNGVWGEKELLTESTQTIDEMLLYYNNSKLNCAYTLVNNDNSSTIYNNDELISNGSYLNYEDNSLYYLSESKLYRYNIVNKVSVDTGIDGLNNFNIYNNNAYTLISDGFRCELYENRFIDGAFTKWKQVTEFDKYIRNYSVTNDNLGEPVYALNLVDINDGEQIYGASELVVCRASDINSLEVKAVWYDDTMVKPNTTLPISIEIYNSGTTDITNVSIECVDNSGNVIGTQNVEASITNDEADIVVYNYPLSSSISLHDITFNVSAFDGERDTEDNSISTTIGYADLKISDVIIERTDTGAVAKGTITNSGFTTAENVVLSIYNSSFPDEFAGTIDCGDIDSNNTYSFSFDIPEKYLSIDDKMTMYGLSFDAYSDNYELNYANNTTKAVFSELTECTVTLVDGTNIIDIIGANEFNGYVAEKEGFLLEGWYASSNFSTETKVSEITDDISQNIILFAKWVPENEPIKATFSFIDYVEGKVKGSVNYDYILSDCDVLIALYESDKMVSVVSYKANKNDINTPFEIAADVNKEYEIRAFFWDLDTMMPHIPLIEDVANTSEKVEIDYVLESAHNYANNTNVTNVYTYEGICDSIDITFSSNTSTESGCDKIYVYDKDDNLISGPYSGTSLAGKTINIPGNVVKIKLTSDGSATRYGYKVDKIVVNR